MKTLSLAVLLAVVVTGCTRTKSVCMPTESYVVQEQYVEPIPVATFPVASAGVSLGGVNADVTIGDEVPIPSETRVIRRY